MQETCKSPVIVALDMPRLADVKKLVEQLDPGLCRLKVGKELFTACGMPAVDYLHSRGFEVFLDLKFHDIPNTVASAVGVAAEAGLWMVNVHASGGERMMAAAREAIDKRSSTTLLIAVTVLTSMLKSELEQLGVNRSLEQQVLSLATLARSQGIDGVVCSAQEARLLRAEQGEDFVLVTPGIRPVGSAGDDQRRICTPAEALQNGSNFLVIGRPITKVSDPGEALMAINTSLGVI